MKETLFILYVKDQEKSTEFYSQVLDQEPSLHVPGMTEFKLNDGSGLGLMPISGVKGLLGRALKDPGLADGIPRNELYLIVSDAAVYHRRSLEQGGLEISPLRKRDWGDAVAYSSDPDGHIMAFAQKIQIQ